LGQFFAWDRGGRDHGAHASVPVGVRRAYTRHVICPACGKELPGEFPFCPFCGTPLAEIAPTPAPEERKIVTVLFCDLVGFTAASEQQDPEDVRARIRPYHARLRSEIERYGGTVEKFVGDAVMAVFGARWRTRTTRSGQSEPASRSSTRSPS
jgi:hypothetical protein